MASRQPVCNKNTGASHAIEGPERPASVRCSLVVLHKGVADSPDAAKQLVVGPIDSTSAGVDAVTSINLSKSVTDIACDIQTYFRRIGAGNSD